MLPSDLTARGKSKIKRVVKRICIEGRGNVIDSLGSHFASKLSEGRVKVKAAEALPRSSERTRVYLVIKRGDAQFSDF
jgi:hypothetical protein